MKPGELRSMTLAMAFVIAITVIVFSAVTITPAAEAMAARSIKARGIELYSRPPTPLLADDKVLRA